MDVSLSELQELVIDREAWRAAIRNSWGHKESNTTERVNWTDTAYSVCFSGELLTNAGCLRITKLMYKGLLMYKNKLY